jgi:hypothetical protein
VKLAKLAAARAAKEAKGKPAGSEQIGNAETGPSLATIGLLKALQQHQKQEQDTDAADKGDKVTSTAPRWYMGEYDTAKGMSAHVILRCATVHSKYVLSSVWLPLRCI